MKQVIISKARQKRLDRYALIKKEFLSLEKQGGDKTAIIDHLVIKHKASTATIYRALKS